MNCVNCNQEQRIIKLESKIDDLYRIEAETKQTLVALETTTKYISDTVKKIETSLAELKDKPNKFYTNVLIGIFGTAFGGVIVAIIVKLLEK